VTPGTKRSVVPPYVAGDTAIVTKKDGIPFFAGVRGNTSELEWYAGTTVRLMSSVFQVEDDFPRFEGVEFARPSSREQHFPVTIAAPDPTYLLSDPCRGACRGQFHLSV
jgi:hypothetical protein